MDRQSESIPLDNAMGFVDLHSHVLPGVDDGANTWDEALGMLRKAASSQTAIMVATPHSGDRGRWNKVESLRRLCQDLNQALESDAIPLKLVLGMENALDLDTVDQVEQGTGLTINGSSYILVELPFHQLPLYWEEVLFRLQLNGLQPIIAHPERQSQIQSNPSLLVEAVE